jgi:cysteine desulfurase
VDVEAGGIDLLSASAHKFYGPKGVGALYVRRRRPTVRLEPRVFGGGHERGLRSGTLNVPGIVGMGAAAEIAAAEREAEAARVGGLRDRLWERIRTELEGVALNGPMEHRLANNLNVSFPGVWARRGRSRRCGSG